MITRLILTLFVFISTIYWPGLTFAQSASTPGPFAISTSEYRFSAKIDKEVLPDIKTEIWARVHWPTRLGSEAHPLLFLLHGNHVTCEDRSTNDLHSGCQYTQTGTCPDGMQVVANHEGYNYLASHLASWGYIVVSVNANRGITCGAGVDEDEGLILARGRLVLKHLQLWNQWATIGGAPASLGVPPQTFQGAVDFKSVGLFGHSRGGEGMRAAYNLYRETGSAWPAKIPILEVRGIYEIGSVDGQSSRILDAPDTAWNQLLPLCDGDVSDLQGRLPFERMMVMKNETRRTPKSLYMVWGANHNFFNTEWIDNDSWGCQGHEPIFGNGRTSEAQQKVAIASVASFFRSNVGDNRVIDFADHFNPLRPLTSEVTSITRVDRDFVPTFDENFDARVDDFDGPTGMSSHGVPNISRGIKYSQQRGQTPKQARLQWTSAHTDNFLQVNWTRQGAGELVDAYATLDFRVSRAETHANDPTPTDFSIQLVDAQGNVSVSVPLSRYLTLQGPVHHSNIMQTVRIPLTEFRLLPRVLIQGVRFTFDRSEQGQIELAHVRFTSGDRERLEASRNNPLPPLTPKMQPDDDFFENNEQPGQDVWQTGVTLPVFSIKPTFKASVERIQKVTKSVYLKGQDAVEIVISSNRKFPVGMNLPVLMIGPKKFKVSRYPTTGHLDKLIFSVPTSLFDQLPSKAKMQVQYGDRVPQKVWRLPDFDRTRITIEAPIEE